MKKLLSILAAVGLTATASTAVVSCTTKATIKDGAIDMTVKNTKDLTWGTDGKVTRSDGTVVSSITALFENSKDKKIKAVAKHVKKELGIKDWTKTPMGTTYFGTTKPSFKDGDKVSDAAVNKNSNTEANRQSFDADAKAGKTLYIVLRTATGDDTRTVAVIKLSFSNVA